MRFEDNHFLPMVFGIKDRWLLEIEKIWQASLTHRGNEVGILGTEQACQGARATLQALYLHVEKGLTINPGDIERFFVQPSPSSIPQIVPLAGISVGSMTISARNASQDAYIRAMQEKTIVFASGAAGTGKTWLATFFGVSLLKAGLVKKIILTRPVVEAGERLGFLPGDLHDKINPYVQPVYDAVYDAVGKEACARYIARGMIEIIPLAFMRGRTLKNAFILFDEAQNSSRAQMKMFLTRLGEHSRIVITGDPSQSDAPQPKKSGFSDALSRFCNDDNMQMIHFDHRDVVRHNLVAQILQKYEADEND